MGWAYYNQTHVCARTHAHTWTQEQSPIHTVLVEKPQVKKSLQTFGHRQNSIKINLTQIGFQDMDWIYLAKRPVAQKNPHVPQ
jgi:hypothetical protein